MINSTFAKMIGRSSGLNYSPVMCNAIGAAVATSSAERWLSSSLRSLSCTTCGQRISCPSSYVTLEHQHKLLREPTVYRLKSSSVSLTPSRCFIHRGRPHDKLTATIDATKVDRSLITDRNRSSIIPTTTIDRLGNIIRVGFPHKSVIDLFPLTVQHYLRLMRLDKPVGSWLLFWPCAWSLGLSSTGGCLPDLYLLGLFGAGAIIMRSAGCVINDMWDRDIDSKVTRTKDRPLAAGIITREDAFAFLAMLFAVGDLILLQFNTYSILLGAKSLALVLIYPLMKRIINYPQLFLGLTFNWGAFLGWAAVHGSCDWSVCAPLYVGCIAWTLIYDTIYAHQDKKCDVSIGVKSTAVTLGSQTKICLVGFLSTMMVGFTMAGIASEQALPYYIAIGLAGTHIGHQIWSVDPDNVDDCGRKFKSNYLLGFIIMAGIMASTAMKVKKDDSTQLSVSSSSLASTPNTFG